MERNVDPHSLVIIVGVKKLIKEFIKGKILFIEDHNSATSVRVIEKDPDRKIVRSNRIGVYLGILKEKEELS